MFRLYEKSKKISYYDYNVRIKKKMEVASYVQESFSSSFDSYDGRRHVFDGSRGRGSKEYSDFDNRSAGDYIMGYRDRRSQQDHLQRKPMTRFPADYPNITVNRGTSSRDDNYKQQLVVAMSSGQAPDMYIHWGGGPRWPKYYKSGFANDLTDMFNTYDHPDFIDAAVAQSSYDGKVLAIPFGGLSGCDIFYNKTIFEEVGIEVPADH